MNGHNEEIRKLADAHNDQVKKLRRKQYYITQKNKNIMKKIDDGDLSFFMNKCLAKQTRSKEKRASLVLDMVVSGEVLAIMGKRPEKSL